jgi:hypothetical protein
MKLYLNQEAIDRKLSAPVSARGSAGDRRGGRDDSAMFLR